MHLLFIILCIDKHIYWLNTMATETTKIHNYFRRKNDNLHGSETRTYKTTPNIAAIRAQRQAEREMREYEKSLEL